MIFKIFHYTAVAGNEKVRKPVINGSLLAEFFFI